MQRILIRLFTLFILFGITFNLHNTEGTFSCTVGYLQLKFNRRFKRGSNCTAVNRFLSIIISGMTFHFQDHKK